MPNPPALPASIPRPLPAVYARLALCALCWGGTFIAGRVLAQGMPQLTAAAARYLVACACLVAVARRVEGGLPRLTRSQALATALLGLTGVFLYNLFFFAALARLQAGRTALVIALNPVVTALAMALLLRQPLVPLRWAGIAVALAGTAVVVSRGDLRTLAGGSAGAGEALMFCGVCAWAVYTIVGQRALRGLTPIAATTYASLWGGAMLAMGAATEASRWSGAMLTWTHAAAVGYLGAFGTAAAFVWYYQGVQAIGASRAAVFTNLVPVFGVALAALLLGEPVTGPMLAGGALVVAGVALTNRAQADPAGRTAADEAGRPRHPGRP